MKLELVAQPGQAPEAVLSPIYGGRKMERRFAYVRRLLGDRGAFDAVLSFEWGCLVHCTPEFSQWWQPRAMAGEGRPERIFLEGLNT